MSTANTDETKKECRMEHIGELVGHNGWVTAIASTSDPKCIVSASRDKTLIVWELTEEGETLGKPFKRLYGHEHFVEDVAVSSDGGFALSGSWDKTLRLWDLETGDCTCRFVHHKGDVMSVSFSADNRQICSGSRDKSVVLWNTVGEQNFVITDKKNSDWISCVAFSPKISPPDIKDQNQSTENKEKSPSLNFLVYSSWNGTIKKFDLDNLKVTGNYKDHDGPVTALAISPDASLCASGGKDGRVVLWDLKTGQSLRRLELGGSAVGLRFNPDRYWLCGASETTVRVWDLVRAEDEEAVCDYSFDDSKCTSVEWAAGADIVLCGCANGVINALKIIEEKSEVPSGESEVDN